MLDKNPLSIKEFKGLHVSDTDSVFSKYTQGDIPFANALDCVNLEFVKKGGIRTRNGIDTYEGTFASTTVVGKPMQMFRIHNLLGVPQTDRYLILTWDGTTGRIYDNQVAVPATNPILSLTGMKYAYIINVFGRMYITPWKAWAMPNDASAANGWVHLYNGSYNARTAGGSEPAPGTFAAVIGAGGGLTLGTHYISVLFESDSGCKGVIISSHASAPLSVTAAGGNLQANLTNIPVGPTGTAARHLVMTKVVTVPGLGLLQNEPFFAKTISDNTTTSAVLDMPDSSLVDSAKDLLGAGTIGGDIIRACVSMSVYNNRMVWNGFRPNTAGFYQSDIHCIIVSPPNNPEQIGTIDGNVGKLFIGIEYAGKVMNGAELNGRYYIFKEDSTFFVDESQEDVDIDPFEWQVKVADPAKGGYPFGVGGSGDNSGNNVAGGPLIINSNYGALLVVGNHGLSIFNGTFSDIPLSEYDLEDTSLDDLKWSQLVIDGVRKTIFWHMGDPDSGSDTFLRIGNFKYGLMLGRIRWGKWDFPSNGGITPNWITLRPPGTTGTVGATTDFNTLYPLLSLLTRTDAGAGNWNLKILSETNRVNDYARSTTGYWIPWLYETGYTPNSYGEQYTFSDIYLRALVHWAAGGNGGDASILAQFGILDESGLTNIGSFAPGVIPKKYLSLPMASSIHEKIRIKLSGTNRAFIQNLTLALAERAKNRPR